MSRIRWVLGNWKQNHLRDAARTTATAMAEALVAAPPPHDVRVGIAPTFVALSAVDPATRPAGPLWRFAQDAAAQDAGAFTGEVGPAMLRDAGADGAILGHSERRAYYGDTDEVVAEKLAAALDGGLTAVVCVGERLEAREAGNHESTVISQLSGTLSKVKPEHLGERFVIAYEPVWAIGTGKTASPEQASSMHRTIRAWLDRTWGSAGADRSILYGGSVKPGNASDLIAAGDIDGFLVGGASLDAEAFIAIVRAASSP